MKIEELNEKYYFHDSIVEKILYDEKQQVLEMYLDFCFWAQDEYKESDPETGKVLVRFSGVEEYKGITGESDWWGITDAVFREGIFTVLVDDDYHEKCYQLNIKANSVSFIKLDDDL